MGIRIHFQPLFFLLPLFLGFSCSSVWRFAFSRSACSGDGALHFGHSACPIVQTVPHSGQIHTLPAIRQPQCGHVPAIEETLCPHSGQLIMLMSSFFKSLFWFSRCKYSVFEQHKQIPECNVELHNHNYDLMKQLNVDKQMTSSL